MAPTKLIDHRLARSPHNGGARNEYRGDDGVWCSLGDLEKVVPPTADGMRKRIKVFGYKSELIFYRGRLPNSLIDLHKLPGIEKPVTKKQIEEIIGIAEEDEAKFKEQSEWEKRNFPIPPVDDGYYKHYLGLRKNKNVPRLKSTIMPIAIGDYDPLIAPHGVVYLPGNLKVDYRT